MSAIYYYERKEYVETVLDAALAPLQDFEAIRYAKDADTEREVIKLSDEIGGCVFLDVTAEPLEGILKDISSIVLKGEKAVPNIICDREEMRRVAPLFK